MDACRLQLVVGDNFASIVHAVEQNRMGYDPLNRAIVFHLSTNGGEVLSIMIAVLVGFTLPMFFTYVPFMERFFGSPLVDFVQHVDVIALGVTLFMFLELEKLALRKWRRKHDGSRGSPARSGAKS